MGTIDHTQAEGTPTCVPSRREGRGTGVRSQPPRSTFAPELVLIGVGSLNAIVGNLCATCLNQRNLSSWENVRNFTRLVV